MPFSVQFSDARALSDCSKTMFRLGRFRHFIRDRAVFKGVVLPSKQNTECPKALSDRDR